MFEEARQVTIPLQVLLQWDDKGNDRQAALDLFDAFSTKEKTLHANMGGHTGVPQFELDAGARFFTWHNEVTLAVRPPADGEPCRPDASHGGQALALLDGGDRQMHNRPDRPVPAGRGGTENRPRP